MGIEKSMKPSCDCSENPEDVSASLDLVLPEGEPVRRLPPQVSMAEMSKRCEELRAMFPDGLPRPEERWAAKTDVPFRLK